MFVQGRNNGQWRRGLAYKSGGLGVAGSNPVCPKKQMGQFRLSHFVFFAGMLDLKPGGMRTQVHCVRSQAGPEARLSLKAPKGKSSLPEIIHCGSKLFGYILFGFSRRRKVYCVYFSMKNKGKKYISLPEISCADSYSIY